MGRIRRAASFGNICMQNALKPGSFYQVEFYESPEPMSEDCLYLNYGPLHPLPLRSVRSWCGFTVEALSRALALCLLSTVRVWPAKGVVLVTINYRLGVFGFLAHPELASGGSLSRFRELRHARSAAGSEMGESEYTKLRR